MLACVEGVNGEGEREREKNGVLRARDEGTPATKTPIFSSPPTDFYVIQLRTVAPNRKAFFLICPRVGFVPRT